jgi:hypothetical protein
MDYKLQKSLYSILPVRRSADKSGIVIQQKNKVRMNVI